MESLAVMGPGYAHRYPGPDETIFRHGRPGDGHSEIIILRNRMTTREEIDLFLACTLGSKSHLNIVGKVVFAPLILSAGIALLALHLLFSKR